MPLDVPQGHNVHRFSNRGELIELHGGVGLDKVAVTEHSATYSVADTETLWRGGLGSFVMTGAAITHQDNQLKT